jgi:cytochrome P450
MVIDECLRVYPPIWGFTRDAAGDDEIGGYHIPAGSSVFVSPYVTHRHPAFWNDPERFDPGRFTPAAAASRPRFTYFPFGGGPRQCIGIHMARLQMQLAVAMVVQRFRFQTVPGHPIERGAAVSLRPVHGIVMTFHPIRNRITLPAADARTALNAARRECPFAH